MAPPSLLPLGFRIGRATLRQPLHCNNLLEPLLGRLCKETAPAAVGRDVVLDPAHRRNLGAVADLEMVVDAHLGAQRDVVTDRQAAREPDLGREQAVPADGYIVADLDLIVDFGTLADHRIPQAAAVDGGSGADFHIVLDQDAAGLRHLDVALGAEENETIAVLADAAGRMDQDIVADQGELDRGAGADIAVAADLDVGADHRARADHGAGADLDPGADHRQRIDDHAIL